MHTSLRISTSILSIIILVIVLVAAFFLLREAPVTIKYPLEAVRIGVHEEIICNDPYSCMVSLTPDQARIPGHAAVCQPSEAALILQCQMDIFDELLMVTAVYQDSTHSRIQSCQNATLNGTEISCQAIYHYPINEIVLGNLPNVNEAEISQLRRQYPLTQLRSFSWVLISIWLALLFALIVGGFIGLKTNHMGWAKRLGTIFGGSFMGLIIGIIIFATFIARLHFPID